MRKRDTHSADATTSAIADGEVLVYVEGVDRKRHPGKFERQVQFLLTRKNPYAKVLIENSSRNS